MPSPARCALLCTPVVCRRGASPCGTLVRPCVWVSTASTQRTRSALTRQSRPRNDGDRARYCVLISSSGEPTSRSVAAFLFVVNLLMTVFPAWAVGPATMTSISFSLFLRQYLETSSWPRAAAIVVKTAERGARRATAPPAGRFSHRFVVSHLARRDTPETWSRTPRSHFHPASSFYVCLF